MKRTDLESGIRTPSIELVWIAGVIADKIIAAQEAK